MIVLCHHKNLRLGQMNLASYYFERVLDSRAGRRIEHLLPNQASASDLTFGCVRQSCIASVGEAEVV